MGGRVCVTEVVFMLLNPNFFFFFRFDVIFRSIWDGVQYTCIFAGVAVYNACVPAVLLPSGTIIVSIEPFFPPSFFHQHVVHTHLLPHLYNAVLQTYIRFFFPVQFLTTPLLTTRMPWRGSARRAEELGGELESGLRGAHNHATVCNGPSQARGNKTCIRSTFGEAHRGTSRCLWLHQRGLYRRRRRKGRRRRRKQGSGRRKRWHLWRLTWEKTRS